MELVETGDELLKALSDLPIGIICIPFLIILMGERFQEGERRRTWIVLFVSVMAAAFLGSAAHGIWMGPAVLRGLWAVLYFLMFLAVYLFYALVQEIFGRKLKKAQQKMTVGLTGILYLGAAGTRLATGKNMIAIFAVYALVIVLQIGLVMVRTKAECRERKFLKLSMVALMAGLVCQGAALVNPYFNGSTAAHLCILIALFMIFRAATEDCGKIKC